MKSNSIFKKNTFLKNVIGSKELLLMLALPALYLVINKYIPMIGVLIAFKDINYAKGILGSPWVGFENFYYLFKTSDAYIITRNTLLYNISFLVLNVIIPVSLALLINELRGRFFPKVYQSLLLLPYFMSMVVVSYLVFAFLSHENGFINKSILSIFEMDAILWYSESKYWPFILPFVHVWKSAGYISIIYLATLTGIDQQYYEAIAIDGGGKWKQIRHISLPFLKPVIIIMTIFEVGKIFNADFGLFFQVPLQSGAIMSVTNVLDTYVYRALIMNSDIGMAAAAGLYQAVVGFILVIVTNSIVRKINRDNALF